MSKEKPRLRKAEVKENNIRRLKINRENYVKIRNCKEKQSSVLMRLA